MNGTQLLLLQLQPVTRGSKRRGERGNGGGNPDKSAPPSDQQGVFELSSRGRGRRKKFGEAELRVNKYLLKNNNSNRRAASSRSFIEMRSPQRFGSR